MRSRLSRLPRPLLLLLLVACVLQAAWSLAVPALQQPDEASHFSYVQVVAERHEIPWPGEGGPRGDLERFSPEQRVASIDGGLEPLLANPAARPLATTADERLWAARDAALGSDARTDIERTSAFANPPLAYAYDAVFYEVAGGGSFFDRIFVLRLANLPWLLLLVAATWWLATQLLGRRPAATVLAVAVVALQPLLTSIAGGVAPDAALAALSALGLALAVHVARTGATVRNVAGLALVCVLTGLTHGRGLAIVLPAALAVLLGLRRAGLAGTPWRALLGATAVAAAAGVVLGLRFAEDGAITLDRTRGFVSYLWQFYLPKLPWMDPPPFEGWGARDVFVDRFYGTFGQLEITLAGWVTDAVFVAGLVLLAAGLAAAIARRDRLRRHAGPAAVLAAAVAGTLLLVHAQAYRGMLDDPTDPIVTGRYLLPVLPALGVGLAATLTALPRRAFAVAGGGVLGAAVLLQLAALGAMLTRFYA